MEFDTEDQVLFWCFVVVHIDVVVLISLAVGLWPTKVQLALLDPSDIFISIRHKKNSPDSVETSAECYLLTL